MPQVTVVYWRDIPAQVIVKKGRKSAKRELSKRFIEAIDMCAMRTKATESDEYMASWRKADPVEEDGELEALADAKATSLEDEYHDEALKALIRSGGHAA